MNMNMRPLAVPTAPRRPRVRTATPGAVANYRADSSAPGALVAALAAYAIAEPGEPVGDWERADWETLAYSAGA